MVHHVRCPILFSNSLFWIAPNFVFFFHLQLTALQRRHPVGFPPGSWTQGCPLLMNKKSSRKIRWGTWMFPNSQREPNGMVGHGGSNFATPSTCFLFSHLLSLCKTTSMKHNHRAVQKPLLQLRSSRLRAPSCATLGCGLMFPSHPKTLVEQIQWTHVNMSDLNQWPVLWNIEGIGPGLVWTCLDLQLFTSSSWRLAAAKLRVMRSKDCWCCVPWQWSSWGWQNGPNMFAGIQLLDKVSQWQGAHFEHKFFEVHFGYKWDHFGHKWQFFRISLGFLSGSLAFTSNTQFISFDSLPTHFQFLCCCK